METISLFLFQLIAVFAMYLLCLLAIGIDYQSGIRKAKQRGERITSKKKRHTVVKMNEYFNFLLILTLIDCLQMLIIYIVNYQCSFTCPYIPVATAIGAFVVLRTEYVSVREKADEKIKNELNTSTRTALEAFAILAKDPKNPDNITQAMEILTTNTPQQ